MKKKATQCTRDKDAINAQETRMQLMQSKDQLHNIKLRTEHKEGKSPWLGWSVPKHIPVGYAFSLLTDIKESYIYIYI